MIKTGMAGAPVPQPRPRLTLVLVTLLLLLPLIRPFVILTSPGGGPFSDFDIFHSAALATLAGNAVRVYDEAWFRAFQLQTYGMDFQGAWTYPPPFFLVLAPLGLMSRGWAQLAFMLLTLGAYLLTVRRLTGPWLPLALLLLFPMLQMAVAFGQNGLLTGTLIGLTCAALLQRKAWAGVPLGLMIIKPHLAIGFAVYVVASRDWRTFWTAAGVVAAALAVATLILGGAIWPAFFAAVGTTSQKLPTGFFPFYRMVSAYAAVRSLGLSANIAALAQVASALAALTMIIVAQRRLPARQAVGLTAIVSLLISPYAFDYDLPIAGAGFAMLLPDLARLGRPVELVAIYALFLAAVAYGTVMMSRDGLEPLRSVAVFALYAALALVWLILRRDGQAEPVSA